MNALEKARKRARQALESTYEGKCAVSEYGKVKDPVTKITNEGEITVLENQPCKLSYSTIQSANQTDTVASLYQSVKLFISPEVNIKANSKIIVTQNGRETIYKNSGEPAIYFTHQEINLELYEEHP